MLISDIRNAFLKFFENNGHKIISSSMTVPKNDPTLLFTNAGMVQFKDVFTGLETREYNRATTAQKCIRAGGKHNDLDQVGFTARHHTFFEMLGNFSFGDYFKDEAINFAWQFLTKELKIPKNKLLVTVYHTDDTAISVWKKVAGDITIIPISSSDNFWSMGDIGPCGPCSEIFYDHGEQMSGGMPGTPDENGDRYMEIWNIVFMQFEQLKTGERIPLKKKSIDTGMGLERIAAVMQGVDDNYKIDLFQEIIQCIKEISKTNFDNVYPSYKVIADHIRSISFLIADGVIPSNEGRGYVLRRILRRAMRHGHLIGIKKPFLFELSNTLINLMKDAYPELIEASELIKNTVHNEEEKFLETLDKGLKILQNDISVMNAGDILSGEKVFKLYDTYGFPLDLTQDILKAYNINIDIDGFNKSLQEQKSRTKWKGSGEKKEEIVWHSLKEKLKPTLFTGYEKNTDNGKILAIVQNGQCIDCLENNKAFLITEQTPFYAECGGQCGDTGIISSPKGQFHVVNTIKFCNSIIAHEGELISGKLEVSDLVNLKIDQEKRLKISANHTATHLLQSALRKLLGTQVTQRGSSIDSEKLRFDFSYNKALSNTEIQQIELLVNKAIMLDIPVKYEEMNKEEAIYNGAMALFGEKYEDRVRTVKIEKADNIVSFELCGGTHISSTGRIGLFKIISETSIGSGLRRIEAITGENIIKLLSNCNNTLLEISNELKCNIDGILTKITDLQQELKKKSQEIQNHNQQMIFNQLSCVCKNNINIYSVILNNFSVQDLRLSNEYIHKKIEGVVILLSYFENRLNITVGISKKLQQDHNASDIIKIGLDIINGKGGGNALFAQGSGKGNAEEALNHMIEFI